MVCYTADKVMQLKQRLNGVLTALKWCLKRHTHPRSKNTTILRLYGKNKRISLCRMTLRNPNN